MALLFSVLLLLSFLALEWYVRAALLAPLPGEVRCLFPLDAKTEPRLEAAVRCFRFLRRHRLVQGELEIVLLEDDPVLEQEARLLSGYDGITLRERGQDCPN